MQRWDVLFGFSEIYLVVARHRHVGARCVVLQNRQSILVIIHLVIFITTHFRSHLQLTLLQLVTRNTPALELARPQGFDRHGNRKVMLTDLVDGLQSVESLINFSLIEIHYLLFLLKILQLLHILAYLLNLFD